MCLRTKMSVADKKVWLEKQPETIIAYKVVKLKIRARSRTKNRFYPMYYGGKEFKRNNLVREMRSKNSYKFSNTQFDKSGRPASYIAYYHLFTTHQDAKVYAIGHFGVVVIQCYVPKESITDVGFQNSKLTIVTRKFTIVGQNEFLD